MRTEKTDSGKREVLVVNTDVSRRILLGAAAVRPVNLISVVGKLGTGKSYLMNSLARSPSVFGVSAQARSKTQGIHLAPTLQPLAVFASGRSDSCEEGVGGVGGSFVAFIDMEGQQDKGIKYDVKLATPLLVVSKVVLLMVMAGRPPREEVLNSLSIMIKAAEQISATDEAEVPFGCLHIILRDSELKEDECVEILFGIETIDREEMNDDQIKKIEERNDIRSMVSKSFSSAPKVWPIPPIAKSRKQKIPEDYRKLTDLNEDNEDYINAIDAIRATLVEQMQTPKAIKGVPLTCAIWHTLTPTTAPRLCEI